MNICSSDWVFIYRNKDTNSKWKAQDCYDSKNKTATFCNLKFLLVCRFMFGSRCLFCLYGDVTITGEGLHSVVLECWDRHYSSVFSIICFFQWIKMFRLDGDVPITRKGLCNLGQRSWRSVFVIYAVILISWTLIGYKH